MCAPLAQIHTTGLMRPQTLSVLMKNRDFRAKWLEIKWSFVRIETRLRAPSGVERRLAAPTKRDSRSRAKSAARLAARISRAGVYRQAAWELFFLVLRKIKAPVRGLFFPLRIAEL